MQSSVLLPTILDCSPFLLGILETICFDSWYITGLCQVLEEKREICPFKIITKLDEGLRLSVKSMLENSINTSNVFGIQFYNL